MKKILKKALPYLILSLVLLPTLVLAQDVAEPLDIDDLGFAEVEAGLGLGTADIRTTIASIINVALGLLGIVAVVIVIYAGFLWMTAGGSSEKVDEAKAWMTGGVIGLIIIVSAYGIARFVVESVMTATGA